MVTWYATTELLTKTEDNNKGKREGDSVGH